MKITEEKMFYYRGLASKLAQIIREPMLEGSLCHVVDGHKDYYQLTTKRGGKTSTVFVSKENAEEVRKWTRNCKEARKLFIEMLRVTRAMVKDKKDKPKTSDKDDDK